MQARYELATDAIKTFHTGVSEDFLLKEEKFKNLRNTLLKSASDFYGKLGALLGQETDLASRRALAQANFELSDLTDKVGRKEDALAAHRQALAARLSRWRPSRGRTSTPGSTSAAASRPWRGSCPRPARPTRPGRPTCKAETLLADLARVVPFDPGRARAAAGELPDGDGAVSISTTGKYADVLVSYRSSARTIRSAGRRPRRIEGSAA